MQRTSFKLKSQANEEGLCQVLNRIVMQELESWFIGDFDAIHDAFPGIPVKLKNKKKFRNPDKSNSWNVLSDILRRYGYKRESLSKVKAATEISKYMQPLRNRSNSFQIFMEGLQVISN